MRMTIRLRSVVIGLLAVGLPVAGMAFAGSAEAATVTAIAFAASPSTTAAGSGPITMTGTLSPGAGASTQLTVTRTLLGLATSLPPITSADGSTFSLTDTPPSSGVFTYTVADGSVTGTHVVTATLPPQGTFTGVKPARLLDTRPGKKTVDGQFAGTGALGTGGTVSLTIDGRGGVPASGVSAVVLNLTATAATTGGYLTAYPVGQPRPTASSINFGHGATVANLVTVQVGTGGKVAITNNLGSTGVIADVVGYYSTASGPAGYAFHTQVPYRIMDTRTEADGPLFADEYAPIVYPNTSSTKVIAVALNVTVVKPQSSGYISVIPAQTGTPNPTTSNLNFTAGQTVSNMAIVATGLFSDAKYTNVQAFFVANVSQGATNVTVDQVGWYDYDEQGGGLQFVPTSPTRILDTRVNLGHSGAVGTGATVQVGSTLVGSSATSSLVMNVTGVNATAPTYLKLYASDQSAPTTSNLNVGNGSPVANMAIVGVDSTASRKFSIFNYSGRINTVADVAGTFDTLIVPGSAAAHARPAAAAPALPGVTVVAAGRLRL